MQESKYHRVVASWLLDSFAEIEHEPTLDSGLEPDFIVRTPFNSYVLEIENSWDSLYNGLGQTTVYASLTGHEPVLVFPADDVDSEELVALQAYPEAPEIVAV